MPTHRKVLIEARAVIELGVYRDHWMTDAEYERILKREAAELVEFLRDHRSRDLYGSNIETEYMEECVFCGLSWELDDTGMPMCCQKAIDYHTAEEYCHMKGK